MTKQRQHTLTVNPELPISNIHFTAYLGPTTKNIFFSVCNRLSFCINKTGKGRISIVVPAGAPQFKEIRITSITYEVVDE